MKENISRLMDGEVDVAVVWRGEGVDEKGYNAKSGQLLVEVDPRYFRPTEVDLLIGDPSKAKQRLGWEATSKFEDMVTEMVKADLKVIEREAQHRRLDEEQTVTKVRVVR